MNKNTTKIIAFIVGIIIGVIALFEVIGVITSTVSFINSVIEAAKEDIKLGTNFYIYQPINILLAIAVVCLYGILSYKMIKAYVKKEEALLQISNKLIMPYPPGIGLLYPGEAIQEWHLKHLDDDVEVMIWKEQ